MVFSGMLHCAVCQILTNVSEVLTASIVILMKEAVRKSEALVSIYQTTRCNIPEDTCLHTHHCENLKYKSRKKAIKTVNNAVLASYSIGYVAVLIW
jgi:hypothetical protein